ncbi:MAG: hypothetical protein WD897_00715 [Parcubacteria group bacterium]
MLGLFKKNKIDGEWRRVSELSPGMLIAVPKRDVLERHSAGIARSSDSLAHDDDDVYWDEIESIKYEGEEQVWDIEVEGTHNFIGDNIFAHNTYINGTLTSGLINDQTISSAASFTGTLAAATSLTSPIINATTGINTGAGAGTLRLNSSGALSNITTLDMSGAITTTSAGDAIVLTPNNANINFLNLVGGSGVVNQIKTSNGHLALMPGSNVGIGTTNPGSKLEVSGTLSASGLVTFGTTSQTGTTLTLLHGTLASGAVANTIRVSDTSASDEYFLQMMSDGTNDNEFLFRTDGRALADDTWQGGGADLAEYMPAGENHGLTPGDLLAIDGSSPNKLVKKYTGALGETVVGVVSTAPGLIAGGGNIPDNLEDLKTMYDDDVLLALAGRVPVKVTDENGVVAVGDKLTASKTVPGYAMKLTKPGKIIGYVLEAPVDDKALMYINYSYYVGELDDNGALVVDADIAATGFINTSTRDAKKDIARLTAEEEETILNKISGLFVSKYHYNSEATEDPLRMGLIAEEAPAEILSADGKGIDIYKYVAFLTSGMKALIAKVDAFYTEFTELKDTVLAFANRLISDEIVVNNRFCFEELCINKEEFRTILQNNGIVAASASAGSPSSELTTDESTTEETSASTTDTTTSETTIVTDTEETTSDDPVVIEEAPIVEETVEEPIVEETVVEETVEEPQPEADQPLAEEPTPEPETTTEI